MNAPAISVIICTHNPRADYLRRTLDALRAQTLPTDQWELLLVDNASKEPLAGVWDLSWHPLARHIREETLGLTPARLRGIRESRAGLIVFVDDDNVLAPDYLEAAGDLFRRLPSLGVASGRILPEYETPPPAWFSPYESWIAVRRIEKSAWSNFYDPQSEPCGAGMCLLRTVALAYADKVCGQDGQQLLGRKGASLLSGEDVIISKQALVLGYAMGQFVELKALHLIPGRRVSEKYLFSIYCHIQASGRLISWLEHPEHRPLGLPNWRVWLKAAIRLVKGGQVNRRLVIEEFRALSIARKTARELSPDLSGLRPATLKR